MRLTQIRLAGFKSFVDPTGLQLTRQRVGIVGPNGCGKSNVIDAVRWVLGESKASELRGESMHDVIFNGSGSRKPAGRASVELIFDNSLGRLGGPWGRFAELSVKRVLARDGQSSYTINGQSVRRKDVYDIFLGTGLGPRAYAIIGQGMISRVIESRPEELRVFLEEAAGVSKYRERRKETEHRLADARENLARVEDIRLELEKRIEVLSAQAAVAEQYNDLTSTKRTRQTVLLAVRSSELQHSQRRYSTERLEAEKHLESIRSKQATLLRQREELDVRYVGLQANLQSIQASVFELNTSIARREAEDHSLTKIRDRSIALQSEARASLEQIQNDHERSTSALKEAQESLETIRSELAKRLSDRDTARQAVRPVEEAVEELSNQLSESKATLAASDADSRGITTRIQETSARQLQLKGRLDDLQQQSQQLEKLDESALTAIRRQHAEALELAELAGADHRTLIDRVAQADQAVIQARAQVQQTTLELEKSRASLAANIEALQKVSARERLTDWLEERALTSAKAVWSVLSVRPGSERAIEAALGDRLSALGIEASALELLLRAAEPPSRIGLHWSEPQGVQSKLSEPTDALSLDIQGEGAVADRCRQWLTGFRRADSFRQAVENRRQLSEGEFWVSPEGHIIRAGELRFFAKDSADSGVLELKAKVESLDRDCRRQELSAQEALDLLSRREDTLQGLRRQASNAQETEAKARQRVHELELAQLKLTEKAERLLAKEKDLHDAEARLNDEADQLAQRIESLQADQKTALQAADQLRESLAQLQARLDQSAQRLQSARQSLLEKDSVLQESLLAERSLKERCSRLQEAAANFDQRRRETEEQLSRLSSELEDAVSKLAQSSLQSLLAERVEREASLAQARSVADEAAEALRHKDEERLTLERESDPIRERMIQADTALAGAQAALEQISQQILESGLEVDELIQSWPDRMPPPELPKASNLQVDINRLQREIDALGAVNLAALVELEQASERQTFLRAQADDLQGAVETLEDAIRKIDRESRALLQSTYDTVNDNFGRLFPTLFGGGEARLVLTGEEILDSGIQVMAQPPGKKNTTIYLLSGGEKTLTAIALVFALFQLNPAPFCLLDEVDAPLDDPNTERLSRLIEKMSEATQFIFITHNKISMELAEHLVGVTMQERGVSRLVAVDLDMASSFVRDAA
jgi:chromosome segregation protein